MVRNGYVIWYKHQSHTYPGGNGIDGKHYKKYLDAKENMDKQNKEWSKKYKMPEDYFEIIEWKVPRF